MTKYILHGGFTDIENELNRTYYEECTKGLKSNSTVLFVYFSQEEENVSKLFEEDKSKILKTTKAKNLNLVLATEKDFINQLKIAHTIFIQGGDTDKLLKTIKSFPRFTDELDGKIIAGSSAGAQIFVDCYYSTSKGGVHKGLGILPLSLVCHYESDTYPTVDDALIAIENCPKELELIVLKDFEWKIIEN